MVSPSNHGMRTSQKEAHYRASLCPCPFDTPGSVAFAGGWSSIWGPDCSKTSMRRSRRHSGTRVNSDYPNPPCITMSLPNVYSREGHVPRYSEAFQSPLKGLVSVALVLSRIYRIYCGTTGVTRMAFCVMPGRSSLGVAHCEAGATI